MAPKLERPDPEIEPRNPVPEDMPTDPPLVPRPFADGVLAEEE